MLLEIGLANALGAKKDPEGALREYEEAVRLGPDQAECGECCFGGARRRTGGLPCRQLLAGHAAADRKRRGHDAGAASRSRPGGRRQG